MNLPSDVPPPVDSIGVMPVMLVMAALTESVSWPGGVRNGSPDRCQSSVYFMPDSANSFSMCALRRWCVHTVE
jgi:hypothetical protein